MTPEQSSVLSVINTTNAAHFSNWFLSSSVMAVVQVESAFRQFARRYEPRIHDASYGYMQLLSQTAAALHSGDGTQLYLSPVFPHMPDPGDLPNNPSIINGTLYDPPINILCGMTYLRQGWDVLERAFGRAPTLSEWFAGYNEGYGAAARGRPDPAYTHIIIPAFEHWLITLSEQDRAAGLVR